MFESLKKVYRLLPEGDNYKLGLLFAMMLVASVLALVGIGMVPLFVAVVIDAERVLAYPVVGPFLQELGIATPQRLVVFGAGLLILVYFLKNLYMIWYEYVRSNYMLNRHVLLQNRLFNAYMRSRYTFYLSRNSAELLRNVRMEVGKVIEGTLQPILLITLHATMTLVIIAGLLYVEPLITGVGILMFGGGSLLFLRITKEKVRRYGRESLAHRTAMMKAILQGLGGFKDAKVLNREDHFLDEYDRHARKHRHYDLWKKVINAVPVYLIELIALTGILFIAIVMVLQFRELSSIITVLALFGAAVVKIKPSINLLIANVNTLRYNVFSVQAVYDDLMLLENATTHIRALPSAVEPLKLNSAIALRNVTYTYPNAAVPAVRDISLTIPLNSSVAFVGPSGAGKTTLVDVILGLLEPQEGTIEVDGKNIFDDIHAWQRNIGYIPQAIYLLDDTIRRNVCFGVPDGEVDEGQLWTAIEAAQLRELVEALPEGVETAVGERGIRLSGGQRQRIGIARALYHNPQVLVMDEATSALDNVTERYVVEAIEQLRGEKTIIMIAHRLTTVTKCEMIYLMKDAELATWGTYENLQLTSEDFRFMSLVDV